MLGKTLAKMRRDLLKGRGFAVLRGVPVFHYDRRAAAIAIWGLGHHLGDDAVSQNGKGHVLGHVKDIGHDYAAPMSRGYQTSARLPYHTDYTDLAALLCLKSAKSGGLSSIVSSGAIFNELCETRPDLAEALTQKFYRTRWGEVGSDKPPYISVPVFNLHDGDAESAPGVATTYVRSAIRKAQLLPQTPRLRSRLWTRSTPSQRTQRSTSTWISNRAICKSSTITGHYIPALLTKTTTTPRKNAISCGSGSPVPTAPPFHPP